MDTKLIKFDKNGKVLPQKINYEVEHEEYINDIIKELKEKKENPKKRLIKE